MEKLPLLLQEDPAFKDFLARLFKFHFADRDKTEEEIKFLMNEIIRLREESERKWAEDRQRWEEHTKILQEHSKILKEHSKKSKKLEEHSKVSEEHSRVIREYSQKKRQDVQISALGVRWSLKSERTSCGALNGLLEKTFPVKIERYETTDLDEEVFEGKAGKRVELKSSIRLADVWLFKKK